VLDPLFWLGLSILLVAVSLAAVLVAALPAFRELARAARSAEKLFDTLSRELPPTLESIRLTSMEITDLKEDMSEGVQSAGQVVQQIDQSISGVKKQAQQAQKTTRSFMVGVRAAWRSFKGESQPPVRPIPKSARSAEVRGAEVRSAEVHGADSEALPRELTESEAEAIDLLDADPESLPTLLEGNRFKEPHRTSEHSSKP
jgi:FtsZ-binding cell division protein ZapB